MNELPPPIRPMPSHMEDFFPPATIPINRCVDCGRPIKMEGVGLGLMPFHTQTGGFLCPDNVRESDAGPQHPSASNVARGGGSTPDVREPLLRGPSEGGGSGTGAQTKRASDGNHGHT